MKLFSIIISLVLCLFTLAGCGLGNEVPSANEITNSIKLLSSDTVSWAELDDSSVSTYFGIAHENVTDFSGYINPSEEKFDMIAVFKFDDDAVKQDIIEGISTLIKQMSESYRLANENEVNKITMPVIAELDNTIILCIMESNTKVNDYILNELEAKTLS